MDTNTDFGSSSFNKLVSMTIGEYTSYPGEFTFSYDDQGRWTTVTHEGSFTIQVTYSGQNLASVTGFMPQTIEFSYA